MVVRVVLVGQVAAELESKVKVMENLAGMVGGMVRMVNGDIT